MKKKYAILISVFAIVILAVLFFPIPVGDGQYSALTYKIIQWNKPILTMEGETCYSETSVYFFPRNFSDPRVLWTEELVQNPALSTAAEQGFCATVTEILDNSIVVTGADSSFPGAYSLSLSEETLILKEKTKEKVQLKVGDAVFVEFKGPIAESYPAQISHVLRIFVLEYGHDEIPSKLESLKRIRVDGSGESAPLFFTYAVNEPQSASQNSPVLKIESASALSTLLNALKSSQEYQDGSLWNSELFTDFPVPYDESFFSENDLILVYASENSGPNGHSVHMKTERNRCTVYVKTLIPHGQTCDMAGWILAFPMEKTATEGVTFETVRLQERLPLPENPSSDGSGTSDDASGEETEKEVLLPVPAVPNPAPDKAEIVRYQVNGGWELFPALEPYREKTGTPDGDARLPVIKIETRAEFITFINGLFSSAEWKLYNSTNQHLYAEWFQTYNDAYFAENTLLMVYCIEGISGTQQNCRPVAKDGHCILWVETVKPDGGVDVEMSWFLALSMEKAKAAELEFISYRYYS